MYRTSAYRPPVSARSLPFWLPLLVVGAVLGAATLALAIWVLRRPHHTHAPAAAPTAPTTGG